MKTKLNELFEKRIREFGPKDTQGYLACAREVVQELALFGLYRVSFSKFAAFQGGTALRILYGLDRYSEDLDFCLIKPDKNFSFSKILEPLVDELKAWGLDLEVTDRSKLESAVKSIFIKETSLGAIISIHTPISSRQKIKVKVEVDTNPPDGAAYENKLLDFPADFYVNCHDMQSLFAGKLHAILRREYIKGRDWYDLNFYFKNRTKVNFTFLKNALMQTDKPSAALATDYPEINYDWLERNLREKIDILDFDKVKTDVILFVNDPDTIKLWSKDFFLEKLDSYLGKVRTGQA